MDKNQNIALALVVVALVAVTLEYFMITGWFYAVLDKGLVQAKLYSLVLEASDKAKIRLTYVLFYTLFVLAARGKAKFFSDYFRGAYAKEKKRGVMLAYLGVSVWLCLIKDIVSQEWMWVLYPMVVGFHLLLGLAIASFAKSPKALKHKDDDFGINNNPYLEENKYSFNWKIKHQGKTYYINLLNPFRGIQIYGSPGAGKSYGIVEPILDTLVKKNYTGLVYDFKMATLTTYLYQAFQRFAQPTEHRKLWLFDLYNPRRSHRVNPVAAHTMQDATDAEAHARSIMLNLNHSWIGKDGDFWASNAIALFKATLWYLKKHHPQHCTLPHVVAILEEKQYSYETLFNMLLGDDECAVHILPLVDAYRENANQQLAGALASLRLPLGRLFSPRIFWALSASEFSLDLNNKNNPAFLCLGNNPTMKDTYAPVLSLITQATIKYMNQKGKQHSALVIDEFPTIYLDNFQELPATARSNKVAVVIASQAVPQMTKMYKRDATNSIIGTLANTFFGQITEITTAEQVQKMMGKAEKKVKSSSSSSSGGQTTESTSISVQERFLIPAEKVVSFDKGEMVGTLAEGPTEYARFHGTPIVAKDHTPYVIQPFKHFGEGVLPEKLVYQHLNAAQTWAFNEDVMAEPAPVPSAYIKSLVLSEYETCVCEFATGEKKWLEEFINLVNQAPQGDPNTSPVEADYFFQAIARKQKLAARKKRKLAARRIWQLTPKFLSFFAELLQAEAEEFDAMDARIQENFQRILQEVKTMMAPFEVKNPNEQTPPIGVLDEVLNDDHAPKDNTTYSNASQSEIES